MKPAEKQQPANSPVNKPEQTAQKKESSGDNQFDAAIDKMLKKPVYQAPAK